MLTKLLQSMVVLFILGTYVVHAEPNARTAKPAPTGKQQAKPVLVLVHGAWADGSSWDRVVPLLLDKGYNAIAVHLPLTSPADDIAAVRRVIDEQPGDVVLIGHSYGGAVISGAGDSPKVKSLVFVDGFALDDGESVNSISKGNPPAFQKTLMIDKGGYAWMPSATIMTYFAPDLPAAEQKLIAVKQGPVPVSGFDVAMKNPAWRKKPSFYVIGTADKIIDPAAQAAMAKRARSTVTRVDAGHLSMLSKPNDVANVILTAAGAPAATAQK